MGFRRTRVAVLVFLASAAAGLSAVAQDARAATAGGASAPVPVLPSGSPSGGAGSGYPTPPPPAVKPPPRPPSSGSARVPRSYLRWYQGAGRRYHVNWRVLAAIGHNESDHGRSRARGVTSGLNYARCCAGPMQLCKMRSCGDVWHFYGFDADRDGVTSVYDPPDAIYAAGSLLRDLQRQVGTRSSLLLAAYNAGPGSVRRYHGVPPYAETRAYVRAGVAYMKRL